MNKRYFNGYIHDNTLDDDDDEDCGHHVGEAEKEE